jgi:hypothetical protein
MIGTAKIASQKFVLMVGKSKDKHTFLKLLCADCQNLITLLLRNRIGKKYVWIIDIKKACRKSNFSIPNGGIHLWCKLHKPVDDQKLLEESIRKGIALFPEVF